MVIARDLCERYAKHWGMGYVFIQMPTMTRTKALCNKLDVMQEQLNKLPEGEMLAFIDVDNFIARPSVDIRTYLDEHEIFIGQDIGRELNPELVKFLGEQYKEKFFDRPAPFNLYSFMRSRCEYGGITTWACGNRLLSCLYNPLGLNTGLVIIRHTPLMRELISDCVNYASADWRFSRGVYRNYEDQDILAYFLQDRKYEDSLGILGEHVQGHFPGQFPRYVEGVTFARHCYGWGAQRRNEVALEISNNVEWKALKEQQG